MYGRLTRRADARVASAVSCNGACRTRLQPAQTDRKSFRLTNRHVAIRLGSRQIQSCPRRCREAPYSKRRMVPFAQYLASLTPSRPRPRSGRCRQASRSTSDGSRPPKLLTDEQVRRSSGERRDMPRRGLIAGAQVRSFVADGFIVLQPGRAHRCGEPLRRCGHSRRGCGPVRPGADIVQSRGLVTDESEFDDGTGKHCESEQDATAQWVEWCGSFHELIYRRYAPRAVRRLSSSPRSVGLGACWPKAVG